MAGRWKINIKSEINDGRDIRFDATQGDWTTVQNKKLDGLSLRQLQVLISLSQKIVREADKFLAKALRGSFVHFLFVDSAEQQELRGVDY